MPIFSKRDIFSAVKDRSSDLAIIFGHIGFNSMQASWSAFSNPISSLAHVRDPFVEFSGKALPISERQWIWFVTVDENIGMTDAQLIFNLESAFFWATTADVKTVITNGVTDTVLNRVGDDRRALFLAEYAAKQEKLKGLSIELTSLNTVFLRNSVKFLSD